jgi:radical SAM/Cys-rich protein
MAAPDHRKIRLIREISMHQTLPLLRKTDFPAICRKTLDTLQVNLGYKCNQTCQHCHVDAGPNRTEMMDEETIDLVLDVIKARNIKTLDVTGGAPEMNIHFKSLVIRAREMGVRVIDRCNLTILFEPGYEDMAQFLADQKVEISASMPCYSQKNVDKQRGDGTFDKSIAGLQKLNALGYGDTGSALALSLVYNPQGPSLPPEQHQLEADYKRELAKHFGIEFSQLHVIANMPIQRFGSMLISKGQFADYMTLLKNNYKPENLGNVMCRTMVSVDWQGYIYDCDFNQMLGMPLGLASAAKPSAGRPHLRDLLENDVDGDAIAIADHCYGCTAGQGSSCGGALAA